MCNLLNTCSCNKVHCGPYRVAGDDQESYEFDYDFAYWGFFWIDWWFLVEAESFVRWHVLKMSTNKSVF